MINPNLARWIMASVSKHVSDRANGIYLYITGHEKQTDRDQWLELYVVGPHYKQESKSWHRYEVEILVGCIVKMGSDAHAITKLNGLAQSILSDIPINIYKYGNGNDDTQQYVGCLKLRDDVARPIDGMYLGQIESEIRVERSTVEGQYCMYLDS